MNRTQLLVLAFGIGPGLRLARLAERGRLDAGRSDAAGPRRTCITPPGAADARRNLTLTQLERQ